MKSLIRVYNLKSNNDVIKINKIISRYEGILACEISLSKQEIQVVYDTLSININEIINSVEMAGYMVD